MTSSSPIPSPTFTTSLLAGAFAGTTVDLTLYPLDTLKTRLQSSLGFHPSGGFQHIYRGLSSALIGSAPSAALFFVSYEGIKASLARKRELDRRYDRLGNGIGGEDGLVRGLEGWIEPLEHMLAASVGEVVACGVRVPTEVVKQRAQARGGGAGAGVGKGAGGGGSLKVLSEILERRKVIGWRGLVGEMYRGLGVTIMREVPFTIIQFPLWEALKEWRRRKTGRESSSAVESAVFGSIAGAVAAGFTTPLDVLKTRIMLARDKETMGSMARELLRQSGPRAFFAGIGPRVLWISTGGAIFLGSYQFALNQLSPPD